MHTNEVPKQTPCSVKGCVHPRIFNSDLCFHHQHFFDYEMTLDMGTLDLADIFSDSGSSQTPKFSVMPMWYEKYAYKRTRFDHAGRRDSGEKLSNDYWRQTVEQEWAEHRKANPIPVAELSPEQAEVARREAAAEGNVQHTGAFILWKGFGKRKIRKTQRNRPAGYHGSPPEQKPREKFGTREVLSDVPMWAPEVNDERIPNQAREREEEISAWLESLDEAEREEAIQALQSEDFESEFVEEESQ